MKTGPRLRPHLRAGSGGLCEGRHFLTALDERNEMLLIVRYGLRMFTSDTA